jgi:MFS family permease
MTSALPVPPVPPVQPGPVAVTGLGPGRLLTRPFVSLLSVVCGSLLGFTLLLPVVPLYVAGAGDWAAGLATGALMLGTVLVELAVPRLVVTFGHRAVMTLGVVLVGIPAAVLPVSRSVPLILAVSLARGAGLGVVVVIGTALAAELVPAERRNEGLGTYGLAWAFRGSSASRSGCGSPARWGSGRSSSSRRCCR